MEKIFFGAAFGAVSVFFIFRRWNGIVGKEEDLSKEESRLRRLLEAERRGRTTAEKRLREMSAKVRSGEAEQLHNINNNNNNNNKSDKSIDLSYPMTPLGTISSCFSGRNGTPRQPGVVPSARARLVLRKDVNAKAALDGLEGFSHVWIIFVFHENTDTAKQLLGADGGSSSKFFKAKVSPPMLNGKKLGVFATRTPHRFNAIGISVVRLNHIDADGVIHLRGADLVDGTPVLDIKPYYQFDIIPDARTPAWIDDSKREAGVLGSVNISEHARSRAVELASTMDLYRNDPEAFLTFVSECLAVDIRSVFRKRVDGDKPSEHSVVLDGVRVEFIIDRVAGIVNVLDMK